MVSLYQNWGVGTAMDSSRCDGLESIYFIFYLVPLFGQK